VWGSSQPGELRAEWVPGRHMRVGRRDADEAARRVDDKSLGSADELMNRPVP
jgi:hypothetical protein